MVRLLYEEETYRLRKMIFQVRNELGAGWNEHIYHQALKRSLEAADIPVVSKPRGRLRYRGEEIHVFEPDLVVWNKIILELKVLSDAKDSPMNMWLNSSTISNSSINVLACWWTSPPTKCASNV